jgi:hypothetical protein
MKIQQTENGLDTKQKIYEELQRLTTYEVVKFATINILGETLTKVDELARPIHTKEGLMYYKAGNRVNMRIVNDPVSNTWHLLMYVEKYGKKMLDIYSWDPKMYNKYKDKAVNVGIHSKAGIENLQYLIDLVSDEEKEILRDYFEHKLYDLELIHLPEDRRTGIYVTQEIIDAGITHLVNSWTEAENGEYEATELVPGDLLIAEGDAFYCVEKKVAEATYKKV